MGRCCGRSSAGCCVPASVLLGRKRVLGNPASFWTAACAAVPRGAVQRSLDCRLRRKDTVWIPACAGKTPRGTPKEAWIPAYAGITLWPPHPAVPWAPPASPAVGRGVLDCRLRRNDTWGAGMTLGPPHPASLDGWPPSPARGEADWVPAYAGRTLGPPHPGVPSAPPASPAVGRGVLDCCLRGNDTGGAGRTRGVGAKEPGFLLTQEGHCGPLTRRCLRHRRPLPRWGEAYWVPAFAGMTLGALQPGSGSPPPASAARGEAWRLPLKGLLYKVRPVEAVEIRLTFERFIGPLERFVQGPGGGSGRNPPRRAAALGPSADRTAVNI
jgi:hypothetical protein